MLTKKHKYRESQGGTPFRRDSKLEKGVRYERVVDLKPVGFILAEMLSKDPLPLFQNEIERAIEAMKISDEC